MRKSPRCLYSSSLAAFATADENSIFGILCDNYHGDALTTTREAWRAEISILKQVLAPYKSENGQIVFEYDIPRLGKRIDAVLLLRGIVFCLEFKVGETKLLEADVDQVLDYALDLKNFHKFSLDRIITPILIATKYRAESDTVQVSAYDDMVVNPLVTLSFRSLEWQENEKLSTGEKTGKKGGEKVKKVKNYLLKCGRIKVSNKTLLNKKEGNSS